MYDHPFYFRARHGDWTLTVAKVGQDAVDALFEPEKVAFEAAGDDHSFGWMDPVEVQRILQEHYRKWFPEGKIEDGQTES